ncbi:hypothetical protein FVE85_7213 [Porphyridium purpureum]|uniref:DUF2147 domain-containing protein n=1 Tax=Porphyridium purpureum TaxID=35688 RepID=A0A5J4Z900_PORPP|nr:hypothetical protein FVE85_7213 [Porphyridium purpureum]|eukprot:POR0422..scf295_1
MSGVCGVWELPAGDSMVRIMEVSNRQKRRLWKPSSGSERVDHDAPNALSSLTGWLASRTRAIQHMLSDRASSHGADRPREKKSAPPPALCGVVAWLRFPRDDEGKVKLDTKNQNPAKRSHPILGLEVLSGFHVSERNGRRFHGTIYNARDGKTYLSQLLLSEDGQTLQVSGCILGGLLCKREKWKRGKIPSKR